MLPRHAQGWWPSVVVVAVLLLGHEHSGIPSDMLEMLDECVEIPMVGYGGSPNVAVAGSLFLYCLAGMV